MIDNLNSQFAKLLQLPRNTVRATLQMEGGQAPVLTTDVILQDELSFTEFTRTFRLEETTPVKGIHDELDQAERQDAVPFDLDKWVARATNRVQRLIDHRAQQISRDCAAWVGPRPAYTRGGLLNDGDLLGNQRRFWGEAEKEWFERYGH